MAITRMLPNAVHFKEFVNDPVTGHHYTATCGETALATAMVCASPQIESTQQAIDLMTSMTREMMSLGWADKPNGATTTAHLRDEAHRRKFTTDDGNFTSSTKVTHPLFIGYQEPLDMAWLHEVLLSQAGVRPIVLEVARAGNLNSYNGGSDEAGVQYHFITIVGINPDGYVCNDGDNSAISSHLVLYPWSEIEQARPCGILLLNMQEAPVPTPTPAPTPAPNPLQSKVDELTTQLQAAQTLIAQLQAKVNQPAPSPLTQEQKDVIAAFDAFVAAVKEGVAK